MAGTSVMARPPEQREIWADELIDRLTPLMTALSVVFLLVVLGEHFAAPGSRLGLGFTIAGWGLWAVFVREFTARLIVAPDAWRFLKRNWWQVIFLALPFLRVLRLVRAARALRAGRVLSSAVRSSRSARSVLGNRVGWLAVVSVITVLGSSQLLYEFGEYVSYADSLHAASLAAISGEPLGSDDPFSQVLDVLLAAFSVVVFATVAGSLGAYFLENRDRPTRMD